MNILKEKYYIALGSLQNMAIDNTKGSKGVDICVSGINEYVEYLQFKIDKANEMLQLLHYKFKDEDTIHNEIEDIQKCLKKEWE